MDKTLFPNMGEARKVAQSNANRDGLNWNIYDFGGMNLPYVIRPAHAFCPFPLLATAKPNAAPVAVNRKAELEEILKELIELDVFVSKYNNEHGTKVTWKIERKLDKLGLALGDVIKKEN